MNIDKIKEEVLKLKGSKLNIKINVGRNKYEYYEGYIKEIHPNIFTVDTNKGLKSYSYSDYATKIVDISKFL